MLRLQEHILRLTTEEKDFPKEVLALQRMLLGERQPEVEVILSLKHLLPLSMHGLESLMATPVLFLALIMSKQLFLANLTLKLTQLPLLDLLMPLRHSQSKESP